VKNDGNRTALSYVNSKGRREIGEREKKNFKSENCEKQG